MSTSSGKSPSGDGKRRSRKKAGPAKPDFLEPEGIPADSPSVEPAKSAKKAAKGLNPVSVPGEAKGRNTPDRGMGLGPWVAGLALLGAGLFGLWWIDRQLAKNQRVANSAKVSFSTIESPTPEAMGHEAFLEEVRYIGHADRELNLLDPNLTTTLAAAFRSHPWVAEVERVEVTPGTTRQGLAAPGKVIVKLRFRKPVLRVPLEGEPLPNETGEREVDALGTLLPTRLATLGLPALATQRKGVPPNPGSTWNDPVVQGGAKVAGELQKTGLMERIQRLRSVGSGWELETSKGPVFWGRTPGFESAGEPAVNEKCRRLGQWLSAPTETDPPDLSKNQ